MPTQEKNQAIELLKEKFSQYENFYITNTESLTVAQMNGLRKTCFNKNVEMQIAKNTLIRKALESLDADRYSGTFDALHGVTALMFSENPKEPAMIISDFRGKKKGQERPTLKAAFINGEIFLGDNQLASLKAYKTKNDLIGEIIGLLMSPIQRVLGALENKDAAKGATATEEAAPVAAAPEAPAAAEEAPTAQAEAAPEAQAEAAPESQAEAAPEAQAEAAPEAEAPEAPQA
jgi:large subunit ribosomal protein L10